MDKKEIKLDKYDHSILWHLDVNARSSYTDIARAVRLSKQSVKLRIQRMESAGVIRGYRTIGNLTSLGYLYCRAHIKFFNTTEAEEETIAHDIGKNQNVNWVVSTDGPYDLLVGFLGKNEMEIEKLISGLLNPYRERILDFDFVTVTRVAFFNRGYWLDKKSPGVKIMVGNKIPYTKQDAMPLEEKDKKILALLSENARLPINKIAREVRLSPEAVSYKIKKFEKNGLICKYFLLLDYKKVGTHLYKALLYLKPLDEAREKELTAFIAMNPYVFDYTRTLAPWQMEIDFEAKDQDHCHQIIVELVDRFKDVIKDHQTLYILKEHKFLYCPLLQES